MSHTAKPDSGIDPHPAGIAITTRGLCKTYRTRSRSQPGLAGSIRSFFHPAWEEVKAVDHVDFTLRQGEVRALIGPNGAGKSTLIKMLCGILHPTAGGVECLGVEPWKHREDYVRRIGAVFGQKTQLMWDLPAQDSFLINKKIYRVDDATWRRSMEYFTDRFGLAAFRDRPVRNLSLGERMRCELVAALLHEPALVFLDEPTIGMDILAKDTVRQFVRDVNRDRGVSFILTTHDLGDVEDLCEGITVINHGHVVFDGFQSDLRRAAGAGKILDLTFSRALESREVERARSEGARMGGRSGDTGAREGPVMSASWDFTGGEGDLKALASRLLGDWPVADITIREPDIETVIRDLYRAPGSSR